VDIAVVEMVVRSGWVARIILLILAVGTIVSWSIVLQRFAYFGQIKSKLKRVQSRLQSFRSLQDAASLESKLTASAYGALVKTGSEELGRIVEDSRRHQTVGDWSFFLQNQFSMSESKLDSVIGNALLRLGSGLSLLAIISSIAPFLGLLGTVWGIMNSFYQIGDQGSASLPVVAPGIAEALITTIVGLFVAIPALFFYNVFTHTVQFHEEQMESMRDNVLLMLKRDLFALLYAQGPTRQ